MIVGDERGVPATVALLTEVDTFRVEYVTYGALTATDTMPGRRSVTVRRVPVGQLADVAVDAVGVTFIDPMWPGRPMEFYFWTGTRFVQWSEGH